MTARTRRGRRAGRVPFGVLIVPDGAAEPAGSGPTSLARARTPHLDRLCEAGAVGRVATTPPGLSPGSETGIPLLLGRRPRSAVGRGWIEAAAAGVAVPTGARPWRVDLHEEGGGRAGDARTREVAQALGARHLRGHRMLLVAPEPPPPLPGLRVWEDGARIGPPVPPGTLVVCGPGAAEGCGRLLGAAVVRPAGASGDVGTDLAAKARAALQAIAAGWPRIIVHVAAPDEAAHRHDAHAKVAALEALDREIIAPLAEAVAQCGGRLAVCPDHGTDPVTGAHDGAPVPAVLWGAGVARSGPDRMTEEATAGAAVAAHPFALADPAGAGR